MAANSKPEAVVIGCGVSGLTSGIRLLEKGFRAKIITAEKPDQETSRITSLAAAAVWYPYSVAPGDDVVKWADATYQKLETLAREPGSGVSFVKFVQVYKTKAEFKDARGALWWVPLVRRFEHPAENLPEGYECGYEAEVTLMDTSVYLKYLVDWFTKLGGEIESNHEVNDLNELARKYPLVINCTGIWARELCESGAGDEAFTAKRGQVVTIRKRADIGRCLVHIGKDEKGDDVLTYIIPRRDDCLLGGTSERGVWELTPDEGVTKGILERCKALEPSLRNLKPEDILGYKVGLRPARKKVRLEREGRVIHNYGHGGDGFTLSWGCAEDVVKLALKNFT